MFLCMLRIVSLDVCVLHGVTCIFGISGDVVL